MKEGAERSSDRIFYLRRQHMCDYSQGGVANRPAKVGEELELRTLAEAPDSPGFVSLDDPHTFVCIVPGTTLTVRHLTENDAREFRVSLGEEVHFVDYQPLTSKGSKSAFYLHRDAIQFPAEKSPRFLRDISRGFRIGVLTIPEETSDVLPEHSILDDATVPDFELQGESEPEPQPERDKVLVTA
jgi:hypothetical protein